jgi:hypothetical protein
VTGDAKCFAQAQLAQKQKQRGDQFANEEIALHLTAALL